MLNLIVQVYTTNKKKTGNTVIASSLKAASIEPKEGEETKSKFYGLGIEGSLSWHKDKSWWESH